MVQKKCCSYDRYAHGYYYQLKKIASTSLKPNLSFYKEEAGRKNWLKKRAFHIHFSDYEMGGFVMEGETMNEFFSNQIYYRCKLYYHIAHIYAYVLNIMVLA